MAYSVVDDLLIDDSVYSVDLDKHIGLADDEINVRLGYVYEIPLVPVPPAVGLRAQDILLLKMISSKLASGRIILAAATPGEDNNLHAYGRYLVNDAMQSLNLLASGEIDIEAVRLDVLTEEDLSRLPSVVNQDEESLLLGFEETVMRGNPWHSNPGVAL